MKHALFKKIDKGFNKNISKPISTHIIKSSSGSSGSSKHITTSQQIFTSDVIDDSIRAFTNTTSTITKKNLNYDIDSSMAGIEHLFGDKKTWHHIGKSISKETNKTTRRIGDGVKGVYNDLKGITEDAIGIFNSPYSIAIIGGVLVVIVLISTNK